MSTTVYLVTNGVVRNQIPKDMRQQLLDQLIREAGQGYRIAFPVVLTSVGTPLQVLALATQAADERLKAFEEIAVPPDADMVVVLQGYHNPDRFQRDANRWVLLWPEQRDRRDAIIGADGTTDYINVVPDGADSVFHDLGYSNIYAAARTLVLASAEYRQCEQLAAQFHLPPPSGFDREAFDGNVGDVFRSIEAERRPVPQNVEEWAMAILDEFQANHRAALRQ